MHRKHNTATQIVMAPTATPNSGWWRAKVRMQQADLTERTQDFTAQRALRLLHLLFQKDAEKLRLQPEAVHIEIQQYIRM